MPNQKVYIETSIISYLVARPSRNIVAAAHQALTRDWWDRRRSSFDLYCSQLVVREASRGDAQAAKLRLEKLEGIPQLDISRDVESLAALILKHHHLPAEAAGDAIHIATAAIHGMDFLLSLNFRHIVNAQLARPISELCESMGFRPAALCTPEELMGDADEKDQK